MIETVLRKSGAKTAGRVLAVVLFLVSGSAARAEQGVCKVASAGQTMDLAADCGEYAYNVKNGNCKYACKVHENMSVFQVDLSDVGATTGKRVWNAKSQHTFTYSMAQTSGGLFNCSNKNKGKNETECNNYFNSIKSNAAAGRYDSIKSYCPDPSKASYKVQGLTVDPNQQCAPYDPYTHCDQLRPDYGMPPSDGWCSDDPGGTGTPSSDPDCLGYTGPTPSTDWTRYFNCYSQFSSQYNSCYSNIVNDPGNMNAGPSDCYCNSDSDFFKFEVSSGSWKCTPCSTMYPPGFVQDKSNGTSCKSTCQASETYDPATGQCMQASNCTSDPTKEIWPAPPATGGQCVAKCLNNQTRDPVTGACKDSCPKGMKVNGSRCDCNDPAFSGTTRVPVRQTAVSGLRYPAWTAAGTVSVGTTDPGLSCACPAAGSPSNISMLDFIEALQDPNAFSPTAPLPIGPVSLVVGATAGAGGTLNNNYSCGCPNLNERFQLDPGQGRWRCMPSIQAAPAIPGVNPSPDGRVLVAIPDPGTDTFSPAFKTAQGIIDGLSDFPNRPMAMVRSQVTGFDTSVPYRRKVWRCADGYFLSGTQCELISSDPTQLVQQNCTDVGVTVKSSIYQEPPTAAVFGNLTNRMLACCMSKKFQATDPTKFHCVGTDASAYTSFDDFYNAGNTGSNDFSGVTFPTRLYLLDNNKQPVPGVYTRNGTRCTTLDTLTKSQQLAALTTIRANVAADRTLNPFRNIPGVNASVVDQRECRFLVRTALEAVCPPPIPEADGTLKTITYGSTDATYKSSDSKVHRCFQADALRVHYAIEDLSDAGETHRTLFRTISSIGKDSEPAGSVDISRLIRQN